MIERNVESVNQDTDSFWKKKGSIDSVIVNIHWDLQPLQLWEREWGWLNEAKGSSPQARYF